MSIRFTADDFLRRSSAPSDPWTMCGWVYRVADTNNYTWFFGCDLQSGAASNFVGILSDSGGDAVRLAAGSSTGDEDYTTIITPSHPVWFFACCQSNGLAPKGWAAVETATSLTGVTGSISGGTPVPDQIEVGDDEIYGPGEDLNGRVVGLKCWNALLTEAEIWAERFSLRPVRLANLWGSWRMLEHTDIADYSGYGRDLSVGGGTFLTESNPPVGWGLPVLIQPSVLVAQTVNLQPAVATFAAAATSVQLGAVTKSLSPVVGTFAAPATSVQPGAVSAQLESAQGSFVAPATSVQPGAMTAQLGPAQATFEAPATSVTPGAVSTELAAAVGTFAAPATAVTPGSVAVGLSPAAATWNAPALSVLLGSVTVWLSAAVATFTAPATSVYAYTSVSLSPALASWTSPAVTVQPGGISVTLSPAVGTWSAPALTISKLIGLAIFSDFMISFPTLLSVAVSFPELASMDVSYPELSGLDISYPELSALDVTYPELASVNVEF